MTITIIGGGVVGTTLALALSYLSRGILKINLIEAKSLQNYNHPGFDTRAIALAQGTCLDLTTIDVWPILAPYAIPIHRIEVRDKRCVGKMHISAKDYFIPALGYVFELYDIGKRLLDLVYNSPGIQLHCPAELIQIRREKEGTVIILNDGALLDEQQVVVIADGSQSSIAMQCGIFWQEKDYRQIAVISNVSTTLPHNNNAFEYFTSHGSVALLPMSCGRSALIWCLSCMNQPEVESWNEQEFCQTLQQEFGWRLGRITAASPRQYYPLHLKKAERNISHRLVLVGNAAQTLHPIAGQGLNLGLRDAITLAETLAKAAAQGEDIGDYTVLKRYQNRRQSDQANILKITDRLIRLFNSNNLSLIVGCNLGLLVMNHIRLLRDPLIRKVLGWVTR